VFCLLLYTYFLYKTPPTQDRGGNGRMAFFDKSEKAILHFTHLLLYSYFEESQGIWVIRTHICHFLVVLVNVYNNDQNKKRF